MSDLVSGWERKSLYWAKQTTWGTAVETGFIKVPEDSRVWPYSPRPVMIPGEAGGDGLPYRSHWKVTQGAPGFRATTTHPCTQQIVADAFYLLFQGQTTMYTATHTYLSTHASGGASVTWVADHGTDWVYATVVALNDDGADPTSAMRAHSCVVPQIDLTIPSASAGETGGIATIGIGWLGYEGTRSSSYTLDSPETKNEAHWHRKDWSFKIASTEYDFVNANLSFTNNATLKPKASGIVYGPLNVTGSVTILFDNDSNKAADLFLDSLEAPTVSSALLRTIHFVHNDGSKDDFDAALPVLPTGPPTRGDLGGVETLTFNFQLVGDASSYPIIKIDDETDFDLTDSTFYTA